MSFRRWFTPEPKIDTKYVLSEIWTKPKSQTTQLAILKGLIAGRWRGNGRLRNQGPEQRVPRELSARLLTSEGSDYWMPPCSMHCVSKWRWRIR